MVSHCQGFHREVQCFCKDFNVPEGINTDEEWAEIRPWLRPVLLSTAAAEGAEERQKLTAGVCTYCLAKISQ